MPYSRRIATRWFLAVVWMALIFVASADPDSGGRGSRLLAPLLRWLMPDITRTGLEQAIFYVRKGVHFVTYGGMAFLFWWALSASHPGLGSTRTIALTWASSAAYAVTDEFHQSRVPSRVGSALDVVIDVAGASCVLAVILVCSQLRRRR